MPNFVGLDVSVQKTAVCVIDGHGELRLEATTPSEPKAIKALLRENRIRTKLVGLEAGPMSQWLHKGLKRAGFPVVSVETRRMRIFARSSVNKTDRIDAHMIAQALRVGLYRPVHVKTSESQRHRVLLVHRRALLDQARDLERTLRGSLRTFGLKVGQVSSGQFENRLLHLTAKDRELREFVTPLLAARAVALDEFAKLDRIVKDTARNDPVARLLMTAPGVGPVTALAFKATIDDPHRFPTSSAVGPYLGLTPRLHESGEKAWRGHITRRGDRLLRDLLYAAAQSHLTIFRGHTDLKSWGMEIAKRRGTKRAIVAVARRLAVVLHAMWRDGTAFRNCVEPA